MNKQVFMWCQWTLLVILNVADYVTTRIYLAKVGFDGEASPWMRHAFENSSYLPLHIKLFILGLMAMCFLVVRKQAYMWISYAFASLNVLLTIVVCWALYCIGHS